ncbi:DNA replication protein DnaC [Oxobacter pfennigii]|uniref:DNA replication protein DnaC n=1 Tax=Oxobacter pfennigii TaxID=36849 RepID=A0A0P8WX31_9CLOT|nr:ATP-binding protein [Oxobacter pfennigii]KPU42857.1 DNA replication protein DnaC [Oxobacter pfennigii]
MNNKYITEIFNDYDKKRAYAEEAAKLRKQDIYKKIPRIQAIDNELSMVGIEIARSIFKKDAPIDVLLENLKQKTIDLKMEKGELLSQNNLSMNYDSPIFECNECQDTGYKGSEKCRCLKQRIINVLYDQSNLKSLLPKENFETFVFDYYSQNRFEDEPLTPRKNMERIFAACINFVQDFDKNDENLFFYGKSGLGKTFLSSCIAKDLIDKGKLVVYQTASNLMEILKTGMFDSSNELAKDKVDNIYECDLLIIDDLGTEYITEFTQMELYNIINKRLLSGKKTLISTNFSLDNIYNTYAERITSRIFGHFSVYKFYGEDIRFKTAELKRRKAKIK